MTTFGFYKSRDFADELSSYQLVFWKPSTELVTGIIVHI
jgi:hypothetical protein